MNKFILVHDAGNADPMVINSKNIITVTKSELLTGCSRIILNDVDEDLPAMDFHITETPEQIFEMLRS